jgi:hypothetical protein
VSNFFIRVISNEGVYTLGASYDIYYNDDYLIRTWVFRKGNQPEPSIITTFEIIKLALEYKKPRLKLEFELY